MPWGHKYLKLACLPFHHGCAFRQTIPKIDDSVKYPFQNFPLDPSRFAPSPRRNEHKGGEPPRAFTTAALIIFIVFKVRQKKLQKTLCSYTTRSEALCVPLCFPPAPFRTRIPSPPRCLAATARGGSPPSRLAPLLHPRGALAYYPGGAMIGGRASRLAPSRPYTREWHPAPSPAPVCVRPRAACRAPHSCPVAVGRDGRPPGLPARHCPRRLATPTARCGPPPRRYMTPFPDFATLPP